MREDPEIEIVDKMIGIIEIEKKGLRILLKIRNLSKNNIDYKKVREWIYDKIGLIRRDEKKLKEYIKEHGIF